MTHADIIKKSGKNIAFVTLVQGSTIDGHDAYCYVGVRGEKMNEFMEASKTGKFSPEEFGIILIAGVGKPTEEIKNSMRERFGFKHEDEINSNIQ